ncbi:hypothetical protein COU19_00865 [Candidatus Kaiserbacteria bacterium CG10_big_fil_rev_8_21_14_0_10_56_12]|uniref:Glycosyltransferase 2-like domain-containing protein n=1 Tax=Candidatus Kaiserbacteria bacterium CG10_big_fil_rev_8_21_14_0_10_56_12 TaxID=1974611 RepID=A0A2H0UAB0_9BACT|nr:MAG: hypothetical protein COU19_00865 [Candidatus Kaiserbacteria bacterium CG10_big_fil_rev_8_21_14_0_10_56_12]
MSHDPIVSIIIPAYNASAHLTDAVQSACGQTRRAIEVIVVDDGSTDATGALADGLARTDARIRVMHHPINRGRSGALNTGISAAEGSYVSFLDADDIYRPDKIARQVDFLATHQSVDVVYGDLEIKFMDGHLEERMAAADVSVARARLREKNGSDVHVFGGISEYVPSCSALVRAETLAEIRFDEQLRNSEDFDLWLQIIGAGFTMERLAGITYTYRLHHEQKSNVTANMNAAASIITKKIQEGAYRIAK